MEFIVLVNKEDWKRQGESWIAYIPFDCKKDDELLFNLVDNNEYIEEHQEFFNSLIGGITLNGYGSLISQKDPECDILVKVAKHIQQEQQPFNLSVLQDMFGGQVEEEIIENNDGVVDTEIVKDEEV